MVKWLQPFLVTFTACTVVGDHISWTSNYGKVFCANILYTNNPMLGITFEVVTLTSRIFRSAMLPLLKRFMEALLRNYLQRCRHFFPECFGWPEIFIPSRRAVIVWKLEKTLAGQFGEYGGCSSPTVDNFATKCSTDRHQLGQFQASSYAQLI